MKHQPLADHYRPTSLNNIIGQSHLTSILCNLAKNPQSVIFYGPPGTGKTTAALILANIANMPFHNLNGTSASIKDIKTIADNASGRGTILYLDEIQYFNKKQQQSLLSYVESGKIILIGATTENPYHDIYGSLLSRCIILEFKPLSASDIAKRLKIAFHSDKNILMGLRDDVLNFIAQTASGDVRRAFNTAELIATQFSNISAVTIDDIKSILPSAMMAGFDSHGNNHYAYISALQKSIRGSDPDAAVFWLMKLLEGGDIISPSRRMLVMASEDIGLANPDIITQVYSCTMSAQTLGLPEAAYPLTQAALLLALAPKSDSVGCFNKARNDIQMGKGTSVPIHIANENAPNYIYPHRFPNHWIKQDYLPHDLTNTRYYEPGDNTIEQSLAKYWSQIKEP